MNVYETLSAAARQWPDRTAIVDAAGSLDYGSLWGQIEEARAQLARLGLQQGQGVGVRARNGRAFVVGALAALGCGAVVLPIHHQIKRQELNDMLARAPLCAILDDGWGPAPEGTTCGVETCGGIRLRFTRLGGRQSSLVEQYEDAAFIRFTSGTTGAAKGVVLSHRAVLERIVAANKGLNLSCEDKVLWVMPMAYHFYVSVLLYLHVGAAIVVSADYLAESILDAACKHAATFLYVTPMHVRMLTAEASGRALPASLKRVMSVSSRLHAQAARDFLARFRVPVAQGYGIIEVGLPIMNIQDAAEYPESIGRPLPDFQADILDEALRPVHNGETGQLALRGPGMFAGYLSPFRTRDEVLHQGWFLTGDLAHRGPGGRLIIDGRTTSVIHIAGHKVFPEEVAAVLDQHPAVLRSRVVGQPHPQLCEVIHAQVQLRPGCAPAITEDILRFCRLRLSDHKVPASVSFVTELDLTPSGKVRHG